MTVLDQIPTDLIFGQEFEFQCPGDQQGCLIVVGIDVQFPNLSCCLLVKQMDTVAEFEGIDLLGLPLAKMVMQFLECAGQFPLMSNGRKLPKSLFSEFVATLSHFFSLFRPEFGDTTLIC